MVETVAAVVVTFNRKYLLTQCLTALLIQSRPLDKIFLVDNASTDGTQDLLRERGVLDSPLVEYVRLSTNTGGAGGFHEGLKRAYEAGFDWAWVMDDDAEPQPDALECLSSGFAMSRVAALASLVVNEEMVPQLAHRGWVDLCRSDALVIRGVAGDRLHESFIEINVSSFVGLAVNHEAIAAAGLPMREFFIHGDDVEYSGRLAAVGRIILVSRSRVVHKEVRLVADRQAVLMGRSSHRTPWEKLWLDYYVVRNLIWLRRRHCSMRLCLVQAVRTLCREAAGAVMYDDRKGARVWFYMNAILDGWRGVFDNDKPRRITGAM
jgi:rhamnopyranosyl-N-acetylglucosaminyl-diphospho-decaprenol beta-1,3/1,4-galactofuranosyltransferase